MWETIKHTNICIMEISEGEEWTKRIFEELMAESFPKLMKIINLYITEP